MALGIGLLHAPMTRAWGQSGRSVPEIVVRSASGVERRVEVSPIETAAGMRDFVRLDALAAALGAQLTTARDNDRLDVAGTGFEFRDGVQYVRTPGGPLPLAAAPLRDARGLLVPVQFALDVLPRAVHTFAYDAATRTLRPVRVAGRSPTRSSNTTAAGAGAAVDADAAPGESGPVRLPSPRPRSSAERARAAQSAERAATSTDARGFGGGGTLPETGARPRRIVAIDAGHGGPDAGMRGSLPDGTPLYEKDVTLSVSRALRDALADRGIGVVMTRSTDTLIALGDRGRIANARHADLFVSVHVNAANPGWRDPGAARGFETYFLSDARTEEARQVAARENASTRFETGTSEAGADPLRFVMSDLAQNEHLRESSRLAAVVQSRLARVHPGPNRQVHQAGFKVLVTAAMPAVLVEVGFGSNREDAAYMASPRGRRELADAIADAVADYLARYTRAATE